MIPALTSQIKNRHFADASRKIRSYMPAWRREHYIKWRKARQQAESFPTNIHQLYRGDIDDMSLRFFARRENVWTARDQAISQINQERSNTGLTPDQEADNMLKMRKNVIRQLGIGVYPDELSPPTYFEMVAFMTGINRLSSESPKSTTKLLKGIDLILLGHSPHTLLPNHDSGLTKAIRNISSPEARSSRFNNALLSHCDGITLGMFNNLFSFKRVSNNSMRYILPQHLYMHANDWEAYSGEALPSHQLYYALHRDQQRSETLGWVQWNGFTLSQDNYVFPAG